MIDIQGELLRLRQQREQEYISIVELLDYLKKHNPNSSYIDIATYLLVKLAPNDIRKTDDKIYGNEEYEEWVKEKGILVFDMPYNIDENVKPLFPELFFEALETVRDYDDIPPYLFDGVDDVSSAYLRKEQLRLYIKRKKIEELLNIDTLDETKLIKQQSMTLTKSEEFIKNTDINKSPVGTAERLVYKERSSEKDRIIEELRTKIAELENQSQEQQTAVYSDDILQKENKSQRISQPQRDIFSLLVIKCYPNVPSRNRLFEAINADMKEKGIRASDIKYPTLDNLIDENLRINNNSPFPQKNRN